MFRAVRRGGVDVIALELEAPERSGCTQGLHPLTWVLGHTTHLAPRVPSPALLHPAPLKPWTAPAPLGPGPAATGALLDLLEAEAERVLEELL